MGRRSSPSPVAPLVILRVLGPRQPCEGGYWIIFCSDNRKPQTRHFPFLFQHYMNGLFKKRNVPQRSGFNNAPALSAFSRVCSSQVRAVLLIRASSGTSSSWPWPWDHLHCKTSPLSGALTLMVLTWHISNRILESDPGAAQTKCLMLTSVIEEGEEGTSQPCWGLTSGVPPPSRHG